MADVVMTRADREAALVAIYGPQWRYELELHPRVEAWVEGEELTPATAHQVPGLMVRVARGYAGVRLAAEASGRAAEREKCAGMVREMADLMANGAMGADDDAECEAWKLCAEWTRDLAERIGKGE